MSTKPCNDDGFTALHIAVFERNLDLVGCLLGDLGADVDKEYTPAWGHGDLLGSWHR
jgi:ankyrin repeat protein